MSYPFIIQGSNLTVVIDGNPHTISNTHVTFEKVKEAIKAGDWDKVKDIIEPKKVVLNYGQGNLSIQGETLYWKGKPWHNAMATRMIQMLQDGFPIEPMVNFMNNLMCNPSNRSVQELYGFLEKNNLPITPDGCFLAYKKVRADYKDVHSGTFDNSPGQVVEMERNEVDDKADNTCSHGLHFCSKDYLQHFGGERIVIVKINPRDVVSIPTDYNQSKGRACRYEVISELGVSPDEAFVKSVQKDAGWVEPVKAQPAKKQPKLGKTDFYRGYSDGFYGHDYDNKFQHSDNYIEGYAKGEDDVSDDRPERYRFEDVGTTEVSTPDGWTRHSDGKVSPPPGTTFNAQNAAWPFPSQYQDPEVGG